MILWLVTYVVQIWKGKHERFVLWKVVFIFFNFPNDLYIWNNVKKGMRNINKNTFHKLNMVNQCVWICSLMNDLHILNKEKNKIRDFDENKFCEIRDCKLIFLGRLMK